MIKNYFKTALRILFRNKGYSILNITGLAIGMACCLLILMFVNNEVNYDTYNKNADRIFRVAMHFKYGGRDSNAPLLFAPMAKTLSDDYPEIEDVVRFRP
ncbi:MAG: ABC transporter permease, partial [Candidatus Aminicenantes bacterium]|nr:ABC transporter permease [Candidatus Aminicenantes bacterium]